MGSRPFMHLSRVDLPEPEGPIITTTSLLETCRSTPRSTSNEPNLLCTSSSLIMLSFSSGLHPCCSAASPLLAFQPCGYTDEGYGEDHIDPVSYTHLRAHETVLDLVCRLLLEKKKKKKT